MLHRCISTPTRCHHQQYHYNGHQNHSSISLSQSMAAKATITTLPPTLIISPHYEQHKLFSSSPTSLATTRLEHMDNNGKNKNRQDNENTFSTMSHRDRLRSMDTTYSKQLVSRDGHGKGRHLVRRIQHSHDPRIVALFTAHKPKVIYRAYDPSDIPDPGWVTHRMSLSSSSASYSISSNTPPPQRHQEIAFIGRSNAGKTSLLNILTREQLGLASTRPGETEAVSLYHLNHTLHPSKSLDQQRQRRYDKEKHTPIEDNMKESNNNRNNDKGKNVVLVDLPGYGFTVRGDQVGFRLRRLVEQYVASRREGGASMVYVLVDGRHGLKGPDRDIASMLTGYGVPWRPVLTKTDIVPRRRLAQQAAVTAKEMATLWPGKWGDQEEDQYPLLVSSWSYAGVHRLEQDIARQLFADPGTETSSAESLPLSSPLTDRSVLV
eukprot:gb/GECH01002282.1/.p1 GENE.gb/GECH01002282.1/~~gb/GECH01002282.1/.p1  ORF type:complete len:435 (+),score=65.30 gb/GECH01002282.1/:1-1305(+)